jgi:hypothetical protein
MEPVDWRARVRDSCHLEESTARGGGWERGSISSSSSSSAAVSEEMVMLGEEKEASESSKGLMISSMTAVQSVSSRLDPYSSSERNSVCMELDRTSARESRLQSRSCRRIKSQRSSYAFRSSSARAGEVDRRACWTASPTDQREPREERAMLTSSCWWAKSERVRTHWRRSSIEREERKSPAMRVS